MFKAKWKKNKISYDVAIKVFSEEDHMTYEKIVEVATKEAAVCQELAEKIINKDLIVSV